MGGRSYRGLGTPPPCPVDDTPFTGCTPASIAAGAVTAPLYRPFVLAEVAPFSTAEYKREIHGRAVRGTRGGKRK